VTPTAISATHVELSDGTSLPADLVVMGVGVRPRTDLAEKASLRVDNGIVVDAELRTSRPDVFAVGDAARYPYDGSMVRIEHFAVAARQGQYVARQIAGTQGPTSCVPFFWSQHHDVTLSYVGHAEHFDTPEVHGDLSKGDATVVYRHGGRIRAVLTIGRDKASLLAESAMERGDQAALEGLV
jgi:NADPH-dependent 2,4-dienoyl-CoA reductase/sulfur reductase-like enzyme